MRDMSRRDAIKVLTIGGMSVAFFGVGGQAMLDAFGLDDGAGSGSVTGGGEHGSGAYFRNGYAWTWFDRGGFYNGTTSKTKAIQGWDNDSIDWFWDNNSKYSKYSVMGVMKTIMGQRTPARAGVEDKYRTAARRAVNNCKKMLRKQGSNSIHARVVGVGWTFNSPASKKDWMNVAADNWDRSFTKLLRKKAADNGTNWKATFGYAITNLAASAGWDTKTDMIGYEGMKWRNAIYELGKDDNPDNNYIWVVVAAGDGWPDTGTAISLNKAVNSPDDADDATKFTFHVVIKNPDGSTKVNTDVQLSADDDPIVWPDVAEGSTWAVTETPSDEWVVQWENQSGKVSMDDDDSDSNIECTNIRKCGRISVTKKVMPEDDNHSYTFKLVVKDKKGGTFVTDSFTLKANQTYTSIRIPTNYTYTITESDYAPARVSWSLEGSNDVISGATVTGKVTEANKTYKYTCKNTSSGFLQLTKDVSD